MVDAADPLAIYRNLAAELAGVFGVDGVHLCEPVQDGSMGRGTEFRPGQAGRPEIGEEYAFPLDRPSGVGRVIQTGKPLNVTDAPRSPVISSELAKRFRAASVLFVPVAFGGRTRAVVVLVSETSRWFREEEVELAYTMANQAAAGLSALDMRTRLSAQVDRQAALARAAAALGAQLDRRAVLDTLCREANVALGGDLAGVYLGDAEEGGVAVAADGVDEDSDWWGYRIAPGEGVGGQVLKTGRPAISNDYQQEVEVPSVDLVQSIKTAVSVPIFWGGELRGAVSLAFFSMRRVEPEDIETLQAIASLAGVACANAEAFEEATAAARTDSLTGLLNHGAIQVRTSEEIWRVRRSGGSLTCLLADLDEFKPINERHGHPLGDELLKRVSSALAAEFRPYDAIARYGGDQFVIVLPESDGDGALAAAERLRECVARTGRAFGDLGLPIGTSVGVAEWEEPQTAGDLLDRAARALRLAKRRGKGSVVVADQRTESELAELEGHGAPSELMNEFWDLVSRCEEPRRVLYVLAAFLRLELDLEEVALYEIPRASPGGALVRITAARAPGDAGFPAFKALSLEPGAEVARRVAGGPVTAASLGELRTELGLAHNGQHGDGPAGSYAAVGLARAGGRHGVLLLRHAAAQFPRTILRLVQMVAAQTATVLAGQSDGGSRSAVAALAAAIDARDNYTLSHSEDVVDLAREVAGRLGLSAAEVADVCDGAMLHDVGKVAIPNEILNKQGPLDDAEWKVMREHPVIGERILLRTPELAAIAPMVRHE
ncbi:MAG TPA: diguanylate cyclase, partial [Thermoleophilaceae bacterium]|nr:diguanylate cyclase [Thermoleophilaceae bacterium]